MDPLELELQERFQFPQFRPGQKEVVEAFISGRDVLAVLPTGTGKSLLYQFPSTYYSGTVIILSPLVSLMLDQVEQLKKNGVKEVVALTSFQSANERRYALKHIARYRYIFLSPEILQNDRIKDALEKIPIAYFVLDEAHCLVQWGLDFRPDYLRAVNWINDSFSKQILALTATANQKVQHEIKRLLNRTQLFEITVSIDRPTIALETIEVANDQQKEQLIHSQILEIEGPGILYVQSRKRAEEFAGKLQDLGIRSAAYHGGMSQEDRILIQHQFMVGELEWIAATNAFGMGIHKSNIRQVIHDHIPTSLSNYLQEMGRASRDGLPALATLYFTERDRQKSQFVAIQDLPDQGDIQFYASNSSAQMNEQHQRILEYWNQHLTSEEIIHLFDTLRKQKLEEIDHLFQVVTSRDCLRDNLVKAFDQQLDTKPFPCCNRCGSTRDLMNPRKTLAEQPTELNWKSRLNQLFR